MESKTKRVWQYGEEMQQRKAEIEAEIVLVRQQLIESYIDEIKKMHPEMDDQAVSEMAEKTLDTLVPEGENLKLGEDITEAQIIEDYENNQN